MSKPASDMAERFWAKVEKCPTAKLTDDTVRLMRAAHRDGWEEIEIAHHLGVNPSTVRRAVSGERWGHVQ